MLKNLLLIFTLFITFSCSENIIEPPKIIPVIPTDEAPSWSPDGRWIAYSHFNPDINDTTYVTGLYVIDTSGQNRRLLISGPAYNPDWSPDSKKITFNNGDIFTINKNGDSLNQITHISDCYFPNWSPNGKKIAFDTSFQDSTGSNVIWMINPNGKELVDVSMHGIGEMRDPDWSPSMSKIIYSGSHSSDTESQIWSLNLSLDGYINLSANNFVTNRYPSWSPDGSKITWSATNKSDSYIMVMNSDGSNQHILTSGSYPSWSPNSKKIVFQKLNINEEKGVLWIINIDGSGLKQLTF